MLLIRRRLLLLVELVARSGLLLQLRPRRRALMSLKAVVWRPRWIVAHHRLLLRLLRRSL